MHTDVQPSEPKFFFSRHFISYSRHFISCSRHFISYSRHFISCSRHLISYSRHFISCSRHFISVHNHASLSVAHIRVAWCVLAHVCVRMRLRACTCVRTCVCVCVAVSRRRGRARPCGSQTPSCTIHSAPLAVVPLTIIRSTSPAHCSQSAASSRRQQSGQFQNRYPMI